MNPITPKLDTPPVTTAPTPPAPTVPPPRPWFRLHLCTLVVLFLVLAWMALINVPAEMRLERGTETEWPYLFSYEEACHGWPLFYFCHRRSHPSYWCFSDLNGLGDFNWFVVAINTFVAFAFAGLAAGACEYWRRRSGHRLRFSLRTFLMGMGLIAVILALVARDLQRGFYQRRVLDELGSFAGMSVDREPRVLDCFRSLLGRHMPGRLVGLNLFFSESPPGSPPDFGSFPHLRRLKLGDVYLTREWVDQMARLQLDELHVLPSGIGGNRSEVLSALASVPKLKSLQFIGSEIEDRDLAALARAKDLEVLHIISTKLTGRSFEHLAQLKKVTWLSIHDADLSNADFQPLWKIKGIRHVAFDGCKMSPTDEQRLQQSLPPTAELSIREADPDRKRRAFVWFGAANSEE